MKPLLLFAFTIGTTALAEEPPTLKTQSIPLKLARPLYDHKKKTDLPAPVIDLVQLPAGKITLRDDAGKETTHEIKPIWIAKYETRWDEYEVFSSARDLSENERKVGENDQKAWRATRVVPSYRPPWGNNGRFGHPACSIRFQAANKYCAWLSKHTGKRFRLPTEAEWEYACRAGGPPLRPDRNALDKVAWFQTNADDKNHPVGKKQPNTWGLYDMLGNVHEYIIRDPKDDKGLVAGGAWTSKLEDVHSGARQPETRAWTSNDPQDPPNQDWLEWTRHDIGFRVVMED
jgi:formylglycine-generating enzyme required for sulfatase activity